MGFWVNAWNKACGGQDLKVFYVLDFFVFLYVVVLVMFKQCGHFFLTQYQFYFFLQIYEASVLYQTKKVHH